MHCKRDLKQGMFPSSAGTVLPELDKGQIDQLMRASLASHLNMKEDGRIAEFFLNLFGDKSVPITSMNGGRLVPVVLEKRGHCTEPSFTTMSLPTSFEILMLLHSQLVLHEAVNVRNLKET